MKERDFLNYVIDVARRFGWRVWHVPAPTRHRRGVGFVPTKEGAGLPDLFLLHDDPPRMILAELKGTGGDLTDGQREFLRLARDVADEIVMLSASRKTLLGVYVWAPGDEQALETILRSKVL